MPKNPVAGMSREEAEEWMLEPPTRREMYRLINDLANSLGLMISSGAAAASHDNNRAIDQLQASLNRLNEVLQRIPVTDDGVGLLHLNVRALGEMD